MLSKLTVSVIFLSLALAVPAGATMITIDDFTSDTLNSNWEQSTVLTSGSPGAYEFSTTVTDDELTITNSTYSDGYRQDVLLRDDYSLGVGETLYTDVTSLCDKDRYVGLYITTNTDVSERKNAITIQLHKAHQSGTSYKLRAETFCFYDTGYDYKYGSYTYGLTENENAADTIDTLYISRTAENVYEVGYFETGDSSPVVVETYTISGINDINPGAAIGCIVDFRGSATASVDNFRMDVIPEPSTLALLTAGLIGLLAYAWRKRK